MTRSDLGRQGSGDSWRTINHLRTCASEYWVIPWVHMRRGSLSMATACWECLVLSSQGGVEAGKGYLTVHRHGRSESLCRGGGSPDLAPAGGLIAARLCPHPRSRRATPDRLRCLHLRPLDRQPGRTGRASAESEPIPIGCRSCSGHPPTTRRPASARRPSSARASCPQKRRGAHRTHCPRERALARSAAGPASAQRKRTHLLL